MGTGKTLMGCAAVHTRANGTPYRARCSAPASWCYKWKREIEQTVPGDQVTLIDSWRDLLPLDRKAKPAGPEWFVIGRDRAKLGSMWRPAFTERKGFLRCPTCGGTLADKDGAVLFAADLKKKRRSCDYVYDAENRHRPAAASRCGR